MHLRTILVILQGAHSSIKGFSDSWKTYVSESKTSSNEVPKIEEGEGGVFKYVCLPYRALDNPVPCGRDLRMLI